MFFKIDCEILTKRVSYRPDTEDKEVQEDEEKIGMKGFGRAV